MKTIRKYEQVQAIDAEDGRETSVLTWTDEPLNYLFNEYPEAVVCMDASYRVWVQIGNSRYDEIEHFDENYDRVWFFDGWYYWKRM